MKLFFPFAATVAVALFSVGCSQRQQPSAPIVLGPHEEAQAENDLFLHQKTFDPWILSTTDPSHTIPAYIASGLWVTGTPKDPAQGELASASDQSGVLFTAGKYTNGVIQSCDCSSITDKKAPTAGYSQVLNLNTGSLNTTIVAPYRLAMTSEGGMSWPKFWKKSDIAIAGDPEAQQVTHAELFYLCGSIAAKQAASIPPMGLSSSVYDGHIFWDAEIWMMPALLPQHPDQAKSIVDYRFKRLGEAEALAKSHGFAGAEYPWESADTGKEEAPHEFSAERHVTADVAYAAWQYYLWTGNRNYLRSEAWPLLQANAEYWVSRAKLSADGSYHIGGVIGPDETAGQVTDDAWTNAVVRYTLRAAIEAAKLGAGRADLRWSEVADKLLIPYDKSLQLYLQFPAMDRGRQQSKQADAQMLIYPLNLPMTPQAASNTLRYYLQHTISFGPAMTSSIDATIAARLGLSQQSLSLYQDSYRPFMRGPWDAFSEKRTKSDVYFCTGMGGCLQTVLYGFGGLNIASGNSEGTGILIAKVGDGALYADPHLPPTWSGLTIEGINFRGGVYNLTIAQGNKATVTKVN